MGFFDSARSVSAALQPLSVERVQEVLTRLEMGSEVTEDGAVLAHFENSYFFFSVAGASSSVLSVAGTWREAVPLESMGLLGAFAENWNRERMFPKVYPTVMGEGDEAFAVLRCEVTMLYSYGLTDDQLEEHLTLAVSSTLGCIDAAQAVLAGEQGGE